MALRFHRLTSRIVRNVTVDPIPSNNLVGLFSTLSIRRNISSMLAVWSSSPNSSSSSSRNNFISSRLFGQISNRQFTSKNLPAGFFEVRMPMIMTAKEGTVDKWLVKEGDACVPGTPLCEVTLDDLTVSVEAPQAGIIAEILLAVGGTCKVDEPIAQVAESSDAYLAYLEELRILEHDKELVVAVKDEIEDSSKKPDVKTLLREIRHLIDTKALDQESGMSNPFFPAHLLASPCSPSPHQQIVYRIREEAALPCAER